MRPTDKLELITQLAEMIRSEKDVYKLIEMISLTARDVVKAERCSFYLYDSYSKTLTTRIAQGLDEDITVKLGEGIAGQVAQKGEPMLVNFTQDNHFFNPEIDSMTGYVTRQVLAVPLNGLDGALLGVLQVLNKTIGLFDNFDQRALTVVGEMSALIVENAQWRQSLQARVDEQTETLRELNRTLESRIEEAVEENRHKDMTMYQQSKHAAMGEMISLIAHQWRQPLSVLNILSTGIIQQIDDGLEVEQAYIRQAMERMSASTEYLASTIDDFRNFFKPDKSRLKITLSELVNRALNLLHFPGVEVRNDVQESQEVELYANELLQVIITIMKNAIDVFAERSVNKPRIIIRAEVTETEACLEIEDNGGGIPEEVSEHIFDEYFTTKGNEGTGLGLYMSRLIMKESFGGDIKAHNGREGAVFTLSVPLAQIGSDTPVPEVLDS